MTLEPWQIEGKAARLKLAAFEATLDPRRPDRGLSDLEVFGRELHGCRLLGLDLPGSREFSSSESGFSPPLNDWYLRGAELVASYGPNERLPVELDAVWHVRQAPAPSGQPATLELVLSVRTDLLQCRPEFYVRTELNRGDAWRLADPAALSLEALGEGSSVTLTPDQGACCVVVRLPQRDGTYFEAVHPSDFVCGLVSAAGGKLEIRHRLFAEPLEKGVIRRARLAAGFLPREDDAHWASACYGLLVSEPPPLS